MSEKIKYPFYRKYPNGYLNFLGCYDLSEIEEDGIFRKFKILKIGKKMINRQLWKEPIVIIIPIKENLRWREGFRSINKPLSLNYIY